MSRINDIFASLNLTKNTKKFYKNAIHNRYAVDPKKITKQIMVTTGSKVPHRAPVTSRGNSKI